MERVGESPCPALGRGERPPPRGAPTLPTQCWGGCGDLPGSCLPISSPYACLPPSPPALLQEEIQQLKSKLEKVEKERNELRLNSDRLESRVGPCRHREGLRCCAGLPRPMVPLPSSAARSQS